ncbi:helix-turn-helix domain-containing protein [Pseudomonas putida]|uniref:helix-turn-helix domain-containing protein n=1 Tax=Pseudomonas putida TaxID=303 RepID=UPI0023653BF3|nr:helix-turn-helix transcriptional regulator [Pseudomonas putida]MDD2050273.1 helix-turn-helix domain-containing protein [Pseudomonas putida]
MKLISIEERQKLIEDIKLKNVAGQETLGTTIRRLRVEVTGLDQATFATMCKMSTKALYQLETDKGNPTINTLNGILRLFGMRMTLGSIGMPTFPAEDRTVIKKRGARPPARKAKAGV